MHMHGRESGDRRGTMEAREREGEPIFLRVQTDSIHISLRQGPPTFCVNKFSIETLRSRSLKR